ASIVVIDLGGSRSGDGTGNHKAADIVVNEIIAAGGKAVANFDSVEDGDKIIATAIKLSGAKCISEALTRLRGPLGSISRNRGYGRIINTYSAAGIYGNFGQANYSEAKLALHGFTQTLAREEARKNTYCNSIAPIAASRMTETVFPPELLAHLNPSFIIPVVAYLCHESCEENGSLFELDSTFTLGSVSKQIAKIGDYTDAQYPTSIAEVDWVGLLEEAKSLKANVAGPDLRFDGRVVVVTGAGQGLCI
ncbi:hypothetical protein HDU78_011186, partial [Chytriomyces hyalinus]